jgi:hypothetical protein
MRCRFKTQLSTTTDLLEHAVKLGCPCNFASYVEWPRNAFSRRNSPLTISVIGADTLAEVLERPSRVESSMEGR